MSDTDMAMAEDGDKSMERKHGGHHIVEMATMRYDMLLNIDRALQWDDHHLANALTDAFRAVNESLLAALKAKP